MSLPSDETRKRLTELARPVCTRIAETRRRERTRRALSSLGPWFLFMPLLRWGLVFLGFDTGPLWLWFLLTPTVPVGLLFAARWLGESRQASEREALALLDDRFGLADRLTAAAEFLGRSRRTGYMEAAIADASHTIAKVAAEELPLDSRPLRFGGRNFVLLALGFAFLLVPTYTLRLSSRPAPKGASPTTAVAEGEPGRATPLLPKPSGAKPDEAPSRPAMTPPVAGESEGAAKEGVPPDDEEAAPRRSNSSSGRSSQTRSSGGRSASQGEASRQSQPSKSGERPKLSGRKKDPRPAKPEERPRSERRDEKESGSTSGRGSGRGSAKSPTSSPWASKDQVTSRDELEEDEDEEVEDDLDESKARGGVQPHLRSRKPPVNRDLQIGFGSGRPNPMANGRGGAGPPKKQRGVAQLVLGVHFPDHISGKPNPGMSKITQDRIEPQAEKAAHVSATERTSRSAPVGTVAHPRLMPRMQFLVAKFFLSRFPSKPSE
ncbi:MAG TPA: hypothetical protein ENK43_09135 [Planctomycetes bacterium]|nr:hypothetical protein [Planctomycetota bacterium]